MIRDIFYFMLMVLVMLACSIDLNNNASIGYFEKITSSYSGIHFSNDVSEYEDFNIFSYRNFYNGGGVAIGDLNGDELADIFFTSNMGDNKLYLNEGELRFRDVSKESEINDDRGWNTGVVLVDLNADGLLDIYVCRAGYKEGLSQNNKLYINLGNSSDNVPLFKESAAEYGLDQAGYTTHAAFFDYDLDGDLDCYILNNSFIPVNTLNLNNNREIYGKDWPVKDFLKGGGDQLLRNDDGKFIEVTEEAGIYGSLIGFGLGICVGDINGDAWPDLYVSNDFYEHDYLYINQRDGTFKEDIQTWVQHISHASMGADLADINNDGYSDIFTTEMLPAEDERLKKTTLFDDYNTFKLKEKKGFVDQFMQNALQLNNQNQNFSEIAHFAGVAATDWSWGALLFDADNDGYRDIYICNGIYRDLTDQDFLNYFANDVIQQMALTGQKEDLKKIIDRMPINPISNRFFLNTGSLGFEDKTKDFGFKYPSASNGSAYGDLDNDGDLDLVVNNLNEEAFLFENTLEKRGKTQFLKLKLKGKDKNTFAIGSKIFLYSGDEILSAEVMPSRGFQSSVDYPIILGLGQNRKIDSLIVRWPDLTFTKVAKIAVDKQMTISQIDSKKQDFRLLNNSSHRKLLEQAKLEFHKHIEDEFEDFDEFLSYRRVSREGPCSAVGDINGDGLEDIIIGGSSNQPTQLYMQKVDGSFSLSTSSSIWMKHAYFEDTAILIFDANGDGKNDIYIGSGGNNNQLGGSNLADRLYVNSGGSLPEFEYQSNALPRKNTNTSCVLAFDLEEDGDLDLYVGSRSVVNGYGYPTRSLVLRNEGGLFSSVEEKIAKDLYYGMVTDAKLGDVTGDGKKDLVIVGEWMSPKIYEIKNGELKKWNNNLEQYSGWWYSLSVADIDNDGDQDIILGNSGNNFYLLGRNEQELKLWVKDFDKNRSVDKILTKKIEGEDKPVLMRSDLVDRIPSLKKSNNTYSEYAKKSIQDLFSKEELEGSLVWKASFFTSGIAYNEGNGKFSFESFPAEAQFSSTHEILCKDLNEDGYMDIILGGNDHGFIPQFSRFDASYGSVLLNSESQGFQILKSKESGFEVSGDIRTLNLISIKGRDHIFVGINNETPRVYTQ